jgi:hypothetical protein
MPPPIAEIPNRPKVRSLRPLHDLVPFIRILRLQPDE